MDINSITVSLVLSRLDKKGLDQTIFLKKNREFDKCIQYRAKFDKLMFKIRLKISLVRDL